MSELELALRALGRRLADEPVPDLHEGVLERIEATPQIAPSRVRRVARAALVAVVAALLLGGTALAASSGLRDAVRDWLGAAGIAVEQGDAGDARSARSISALGLGKPIPLDDAAEALGGRLPLVSRLGRPAAALRAHTPAGTAISLVWRPGGDLAAAPDVPSIGALLTVAPPRDSGDPFVLGKLVGNGVQVSFVDAPGVPDAVWIEGAPHAVRLFDGRRERFRLAANVLAWRHAGRVYRLESSLDRAQALALAATVR